MRAEETDIAVVGAGPSGLIAAREAAMRRAKVIVFEEHPQIGLPCHCAGLLSIKGLKKINAPLYKDYVQNRVKGARFFSPSGISFTIERKEPVACVVNRRLFDCFLAKQVMKTGSEIRMKSRVQMVKRDEDGRWVLNIRGGSPVKAKLLIDAEGSSTRILKMTELKTLETNKLLKGLQVDISGIELDSEYVEVHFGNKIAPGFFAWVIPLGDKAARIGLACRKFRPKDLLFNFIKKRFGDLEKISIHTFYSGSIITCGPIKRTYANGLLVVGDAAGQVKPISGGGVILGGICASIAGRVASKAVELNALGKNFLKNYESEWKAILGREFRVSLLARKILNLLSDRDFDKIFSIIGDKEVLHEVSVKGDMDMQGTSILKAFRKRRRILKFLPIIFRAAFRGLVGGTI
ncbi:NAD(P)/FAD-dependent oxidoreductase [Candidatus Bathyarchaeota archaeon]|nr:NAD(P)/FAD-dependent oxidoreductase [Candidatus Bathyarchaeota archaeon]